MTEPAIVPELWAWVADNDGIVASYIPNVGATPFVFGEERNARGLREFVEDIARDAGKTVRLVRYQRASVEDVVTPTEGGPQG
jgi:hypothetical protein